MIQQTDNKNEIHKDEIEIKIFVNGKEVCYHDENNWGGWRGDTKINFMIRPVIYSLLHSLDRLLAAPSGY